MEVGLCYRRVYPIVFSIMDDFPVTTNLTNWQWMTDLPDIHRYIVWNYVQYYPKSNWNIWRIGRLSGNASFQINDVPATTSSSNIPTINLSAFLMSYTVVPTRS